jgi:hypothetical protein
MSTSHFHVAVFHFHMHDVYPPSSPAYGVYVSQLIRYTRALSTYDNFFLIPDSLLTNKLMLQGFVHSRLQTAFPNFFFSRYNKLVCQYSLPLSQMLLDVFHTKPFLTHWFWLQFVSFTWFWIGLTAGVTGRQGMFSPPMELIPPLVYPEVRIFPIFWFVFPTGLVRSMAVI